MHKFVFGTLAIIALGLGARPAAAAPALDVVGADFIFPHSVKGFPTRLSDFPGLQINSFVTNDDVKLTYWEAGEGRPLIFVPGWSGNGAEYINVMFALSKHYRVIVLDPRNQGLSQRVTYGGRIGRFSMDLKQLVDHLGIEQVDICGWSMGASVIWGYIDLFGTKSIRKTCFVDEPISIYSHDDWTEQQRLDAGGSTTSAERMVAGFTGNGPLNTLITDMKPLDRSLAKDSLLFVNSVAFGQSVVTNDQIALSRVLFDHVTNDWRDVIQSKIDVPTAIFTGTESNNLPSQRWAASVIPNATLYVYSKAEQGDHFLMFKNPAKFTADLRAFLDG